MENLFEREKSGFPESRGSAKKLLAIFKEVEKSGQGNKLTGEDLKELSEIMEVRSSDPEKAKILEKRRMERIARDQAELDQYYADLHKQMDDMIKR